MHLILDSYNKVTKLHDIKNCKQKENLCYRLTQFKMGEFQSLLNMRVFKQVGGSMTKCFKQGLKQL